MQTFEDLTTSPNFRRVPFRQRCQRKCCGTVLWTKPQQTESDMKKGTLAAQKQLLVPLNDVHIEGVLEAGHATINV
jgi:hypothetical protein